MTTSVTFAPDAGALSSLLEAGRGPVLVLDPCGALWAAFWQSPGWKNLWQAWRLAPGQTQEGDVWNVLGSMRHVSAADGSAALAAALFPPRGHSDLTRRLMSCLLTFADDTGHFAGHSAGLGALAGQLWAGDLWSNLARWTRQYPHHPALQAARACSRRRGPAGRQWPSAAAWKSSTIRTWRRALRARRGSAWARSASGRGRSSS
ncbi:hypothetical protein JNO12_24655 [Erwinia aphidicola]|nr:hypothetical protein [Erwinia aphidicola]